MDGMNVDELLTIVSLKEGLNPAEHFVRIKKRKDMSTLKYFVPHRTDLIDTYVSILKLAPPFLKIFITDSFKPRRINVNLINFINIKF